MVRIVVDDDDPALLRPLAMRLREEGNQTVQITSGAGAG